jgi:hypothetical protein
MTSKMAAVGAKQSLQNARTCSAVKRPAGPARSDQNETSSARRRATVGCPTKTSAARSELAGSSITPAALERSMRITGIKIVNTEITKPGAASTFEEPCNCVARGFSNGAAMRGAIQVAKIGPASAAVGTPTSRP